MSPQISVGFFNAQIGTTVALYNEMCLNSYLWLLPLVAFVQIAEASKPLAPSPFRRLCEKALLSAGVYRPEIRARVSSVTQTIKTIGNFAIVISDEMGKEVFFSRTNRGLFDLQFERYFPRTYFSLESFDGKRTLDLACGDGRLVEDLRYAGIDIVGLDIYLTPYQMTKPYYSLADVRKTGFPDQSFDRILTIQGPLTYLFENGEARDGIFKEVHRILRPGGRILISPLPLNSIAELPPLPEGFRLVAWASADWMMIPAENTMEEHANFWIELEKI